MARGRRFLALLLAVLLAAALLCSACFITAEAGHDCCGEGCPICRQLTVCQQLLRLSAGVGAALCAAAFLRHAPRCLGCCGREGRPRLTLTVLKVKLSD